MALSNRYPAGNRGRAVTQSRPLPFPRSTPLPDNDNTPGQSRPRPRPKPFPIPANDNNRVGRPRFPIAALKILRRNPWSFVATEMFKDLLGPWFYTNLQAAFLNGWQLQINCRSGSNQWIPSFSASSCPVRQRGLAASMKTSVSECLKANPAAIKLGQYFGPYIATGLPAWDQARGYGKVGTQNLPDFDEILWPESWPLPNPDTLPVGMPYPRRSPDVRPEHVPGQPPLHRSLNSSRTNDSPGTTTNTGTRFNPRDRPRRPPKGTKERKIKGKGLLAIFGKGLSGYSEVGDFVESLWDALPERYQTKDAHLGDKMMDLYENINHLDMGEAVENLIKNEIEDRIVGKLIGKATDTFGNNLGNALVTGLGRG